MDLGHSKIILFCLGLILGDPALKAQDFTPAPPPEVPELTSLLDRPQIEDLVWREINQILTQFKVSPRPFLWVQVNQMPLATKTPASWDITFKVNGEGSLLLEKEARKRIARTLVAKGYRFQIAPAFALVTGADPLRDQQSSQVDFERPLVVIKTPLSMGDGPQTLLPSLNLGPLATSWYQALRVGKAWSEKTQVFVLVSLVCLTLLVLGIGARTRTAKRRHSSQDDWQLPQIPDLRLKDSPQLKPTALSPVLQDYYLLSQLRRSSSDSTVQTKISFCSKSLGSDLRPRVRNHPVSKIDR